MSYGDVGLVGGRGMRWTDVLHDPPPFNKWLLFFTKEGEVIHDFIRVNAFDVAYLYRYRHQYDCYGKRLPDCDQHSYKEHVTHWMIEPPPPVESRSENNLI